MFAPDSSQQAWVTKAGRGRGEGIGRAHAHPSRNRSGGSERRLAGPEGQSGRNLGTVTGRGGVFESVIFLRNERSRSIGITGHHQAETPVIFSGIRRRVPAPSALMAGRGAGRRNEGLVKNKAVYLAAGVRCSGHKEILGLWIEQTEGAKFWLRVTGHARVQVVDHDRLRHTAEELQGAHMRADPVGHLL